MNKQEFLIQLRQGLAGLPQDDIEECLSFYNEMIEDRIEEGLTEEEAVSAAGTVDEILVQVITDIPLTKIAKERIIPKRQLRVWEIILLVLGSPIWVSLGIGAGAVVIALYTSLWAIIVSLWAAFAALVGGALGAIISGAVFAFIEKNPAGIAVIGAGLLLAGLSVFLFFGCKAAARGILILTKKLAVWLKNCFIKKEDVK